MKRLVPAAALLGALAGLVAVLVYRVATRPREFGWYGYSPLTSAPREPLFGFDPWWPGIVVAPLVAAVVTAAVVVLAVRRGWVRDGR